MTEILREYVMVGSRHVHLRRAGSGPVLVMNHPSPGSSFTLEPLIRRLATSFTVLAMDTPGYGLSDPLPEEEPTVGDYALALEATLDAAGLDRPHLYGAHTGAKIALELAARDPGRVDRLILDGLGLYDEDERQDLIANYTPPLEPDAHGSHLLRYWAIRRDMHVFFPWYRHTADARMARDLPDPETFHRHVVDFLLAGSGYWKGYRAAFTHDTAGALGRLRTPTLLLAASTDPLRAHLRRMPASETLQVSEPDPRSTDPLGDVADRITRFLAG